MAMKEVFLYASEAAVAGTGTSAIYKASDFLGAEGTATENVTLFNFRKSDGSKALGASDGGSATLSLTHTANAKIEVMQAMAELMASPGGFKIVADEENGIFMDCPNIASTGTAVTISEADVTI